MKIRLQGPGGWTVDRIPAWIKWATVEPGKLGAKYDGIYWDPPSGEKYEWCECLCVGDRRAWFVKVTSQD